MIKLPKEVVVEFAEELNTLINGNELIQQEAEAIKKENAPIEDAIAQKEKMIENIKAEIELLKADLKEVPEVKEPDQKRVEELIQVLVLSGYYKKVTNEDGEEYLEETGEYDNKDTEDTTETKINNPEENITVVTEVEEIVVGDHEEDIPEQEDSLDCKNERLSLLNNQVVDSKEE